jgi:hypothetical protein
MEKELILMMVILKEIEKNEDIMLMMKNKILMMI